MELHEEEAMITASLDAATAGAKKSDFASTTPPLETVDQERAARDRPLPILDEAPKNSSSLDSTRSHQESGLKKKHAIRYASVCDGIGSVHVAWKSLGWQCAWTSEIEPFAAAVVDQRFGFTNVKDMTTLTKEMLDEYGRIDLLVGGTPCQSFSVAGKREGLATSNGGLALSFARLVGILRPTWFVWENVPGVLSSNGGKDFGSILGELAQHGYGFAYRVLDAQWFGVAQRRRRVFVVGHLGDWRRAAAVLFEPESVFGDPPTRRSQPQDTPTTTCEGVVRHGGTGDVERQQSGCVGFHHNARGSELPSRDRDTSVADSLTASQGAAVALADNARHQARVADVSVADMEHTERTAWAFDGRNHATSEDLYHTLRVGRDSGDAVAVGSSEVAGTLRSNQGDGFRSNGTPVEGVVIMPTSVRRLTPRESERLQGFPDDYTAITYDGKPAKDGRRYKALGNSMAVPVMQWIGQRIEKVETMDDQEQG